MKNDLVEFGRQWDLDYLPVIKAITTKFPGNALKLKYAEHRATLRELNPTATEFNVLDACMKREKQDLIRMRSGELEKKPADTKDRDADLRCLRCGQVEHRRSNCTSQTSSKSMGSSSSRKQSSGVNALSKQPGKPCPACQGQHTFVNKNGGAMFKSRLSSCSAWRDMSLTDRANMVESVKGCSLCTDQSGKHKKDGCDAKNKKGDPMKACQEKVSRNTWASSTILCCMGVLSASVT